ncbi:isochorismatase family cysteine hydrolase [Streptomyces ipomoeae]|uniref:isochorismatase family cysteine hydrolase n=1 Tax=Streptomyces ipomoeae TaxID=103232 RepID=UPI001146933E|nr:isochorismatase family cysteine hydrolase [Streptomyces ipomoeae]TQE33186.1 cysteine hydrolase [Streptomyces ipomoeae]
MNPGTSVLVVIDVQRGFVNHHSEHAVPAVARLVQQWTAAGLPVVFARFHNVPGSPYERISNWTRLRDPEEQALVDELTPYVDAAAAVIDKSVSSALTPELERLLAERGWTDLVLCGIDTDSCVYDTAVAAYHHGGLRPWIVTDACASSGGTEMHEAALLLARRNIGGTQLLTVDEVAARFFGCTSASEGACA